MTEYNLNTPDKFSQGEPLNLLHTCINYVANNLDLVESFHNFPSQIGKEIFSCADCCEQFAVPEAQIIHRTQTFLLCFSGRVPAKIMS